MYCIYNNGCMLDVNSVVIDRLLKYGLCSYTDGQVWIYTERQFGLTITGNVINVKRKRYL